jgi:cell division protein FtsZ
VGGDAEIIFGAGNEAAMHGEVRVTVIATGFDRSSTGEHQTGRVSGVTGVIPFSRQGRVSGASTTVPQPAPAPGHRGQPRAPSPPPATDIPEMEIPTFIRRQMD